MAKQDWETLDTQKVLEKVRAQRESITSGNVGSYPVPIGNEPLRPVATVKPRKKREKK
jgi:hypothetical protein